MKFYAVVAFLCFLRYSEALKCIQGVKTGTMVVQRMNETVCENGPNRCVSIKVVMEMAGTSITSYTKGCGMVNEYFPCDKACEIMRQTAYGNVKSCKIACCEGDLCNADAEEVEKKAAEPLECYTGSLTKKDGSILSNIMTKTVCDSNLFNACATIKTETSMFGMAVQMETRQCVNEGAGCDSACKLLKSISSEFLNSTSCSAECCQEKLCNGGGETSAVVVPNNKDAPFKCYSGILVTVANQNTTGTLAEFECDNNLYNSCITLSAETKTGFIEMSIEQHQCGFTTPESCKAACSVMQSIKVPGVTFSDCQAICCTDDLCNKKLATETEEELKEENVDDEEDSNENLDEENEDNENTEEDGDDSKNAEEEAKEENEDDHSEEEGIDENVDDDEEEVTAGPFKCHTGAEMNGIATEAAAEIDCDPTIYDSCMTMSFEMNVMGYASKTVSRRCGISTLVMCDEMSKQLKGIEKCEVVLCKGNLCNDK